MSPPKLDAFLQAAGAGMPLWVDTRGDQVAVVAGAQPAGRRAADAGACFVQALREAFGLAASAVAEREYGLADQPRPVLPARTVIRAAACAETALTMLSAQATVLQFELSATMAGWRFTQICWQSLIDPKALCLERRRAIDATMAAHFGGTDPLATEQACRLLREALTQGLH
jgi:hypothetical protein